MKEEIKNKLNESAELKKSIANNLTDKIEEITKAIILSIKNGGKIILFGNGGSAADAQHIQGELTHQFEIKDRKAIPCIALNTNISVLTAIGNDRSYDEVFERQVEGLVNDKDIVVGLTTSGNSINVIRGLEKAKEHGATTISFTGKDGGKIKDVADINLIIPSNSTARIQEAHITIGHIICGLIEKDF